MTGRGVERLEADMCRTMPNGWGRSGKIRLFHRPGFENLLLYSVPAVDFLV